HASPVLHAIQYLLGRLDPSYLTRLRELGGLQAYPSRTKDPDPIDYSTGSVGLGAVAPLFGAAVHRYLAAHFDRNVDARYIALIGDAELDEGNVWEAIADPVSQGLGNVLWVVDLNRQSLDRVIPGIKAAKLKQQFVGNDWQVIDAKYGALLQAAFAREGGDALRNHIDAMSNEQYQSLFSRHGDALRERFLDGADAAVRRLVSDIDDAELDPLVKNLGGHDVSELLRAYREADADPERPAVVFAYTVKGWGLPIAGDPLNHSALLNGDQLGALRAECGLAEADEWSRFAEDSPEGQRCAAVSGTLVPPATAPVAVVTVPDETGFESKKAVSTQEAFGRILVALGRNEDLARRMVTTSPDVSVSTNLGGWINKFGVFAPKVDGSFLDDQGRLLRWHQSPEGRHLELGISEMNLFLLLGQLGLSQELMGELLLPIGTVYDPFVCRGLDAFIYGTYSASKFVVVGTPSGVTLSPEGGAHQSTITASIGLELPGVVFAEPAYAQALDWWLCAGLQSVADRDAGESLYLRLTTRPLDQAPFAAARERLGADELRRQVLAGGYRLLDAADNSRPRVNLAASGAVMPEVLAAAAALDDEGVAASVIDVTSLDRLYRGWKAATRVGVRSATATTAGHHLAALIPGHDRRTPIVTVHDAASHAMAWIGSVFGAPVIPLGVDGFGQSGTVADLYGVHDLLPDAIVNAALLSLP
ncbi:MAG TPA: 1-deoxy-D-xylulose-5-phosphate synthase N-terminal domain-containing protein, partial [Acidimicrobiales bacterium]|nr:1-deoxy-D-xylulose-5-phosphate synthase N-terminal domain-containing protein [Acidimicrobiales bacterium]